MPSEDPSASESNSRLLNRIERSAGIPGLAGILSRLPPTDLQSLLLEVYRMAARRRTPAELLTAHLQNRFTRPAKVPPATLLAWESLALSRLPPGFEAIELAPTCPLGTCSVLANVDQNWAVSTVRNIEVVSDPTNVMALESAVRRRALRSQAPKTNQAVHLAARHRALRPQRYADSSMAAHFSLFSLCSAGRDSGGRGFEISALKQHCEFYLGLLNAFLQPSRTLVVSLTDFGPLDDKIRLEREFLAPLRTAFANVISRFDPERKTGRGYYRDLCFKIHIQTASDALFEVADGGSVDWLEKLLSDSKERFVISGIGSERVCDVFAPA